MVNASSSLGLVGAPGLDACVTSKHGVIGITKVAALEQAARGVRVNAVCPGPIAGRMIKALEDAAFGDSGTTFASFVLNLAAKAGNRIPAPGALPVQRSSCPFRSGRRRNAFAH